MLFKEAEYITGENGNEAFSIVEEGSHFFEKTASLYDPAVAEYLEKLERENGYLYALINALTAGEYFGPNRNGDFFPEEALKKYHHTFVDHGHVYKHHINKDPKKSMGRVIFSHYNPKMHRVEIVVKLQRNHPDVQRILSEIEQGRIPKTSMGVRTPSDTCSITLKRAKTRAQYSDYLRNRMNQVLEDGRRVYAINNDKLKFFDISLVTIPADPTSSFMSPIIGMDKVASVEEPMELEKAADDKSAAMTKRIPVELESITEDPNRLIVESQARLTDAQIKKLAEFPLNETMSTMLALRVMPLREDFQKLALYCAKRFELAEKLEKQGILFEVTGDTKVDIPEKVSEEFVNEKIAEIFSENISSISLTKPLIINRILEKQAALANISINTPFPNKKETTQSLLKSVFIDDEPKPALDGVSDAAIPLATLGTIYAGYASLFKETANVTNFTKFVGRNPWVGPIIGLTAGVLLNRQQQKMLEQPNKALYKTASRFAEKAFASFAISAPISYYQSAKAEAKARSGQPISKTEDFVRRNPFVTSVVGAAGIKGLTGAIGKSFNKASKSTAKIVEDLYPKSIFSKTSETRAEYLSNLGPETINSIFNEVIS
jgi:ElaB/YqjD/DUF883 family membrane-anchored ribosome-binding protein